MNSHSQKRLALVLCASLSLGSFAAMHSGEASPGINPDSNCKLFSAQPAYAAEVANSFESAKEFGTKSNFEKFDIYTLLLSEDKRTKKKQVAIYGELKLPYSRQDIDVSDHDENFFKSNPYLTNFFEWDDKHLPENKWDATIFKANISPIAFNSDETELKITIDQEEFTVKLPTEFSALNTEELNAALTEHEAEYQTVKSAGMKITKDTEDAFIKATEDARAMLEEAKSAGTKLKQEDIDKMREEYNIKFAELKPEPFDRGALNEALALAKEADDKNGRDNKRYEQEGYKVFSQLYYRAQQLEQTEDLNSIVGPREGDPLPTHRDFEEVPKKLNDAREALKLMDYTPANTQGLKAAYDEAISLPIPDNKGYTPVSAEPFYSALVKALEALSDPYADQEQLDQLEKELKEAQAKLKFTDLKAEDAFTMKIMYRHPLDDAPSGKIDDYFKEGDNNITEKLDNIKPGQEMRIYFDDKKLMKEFPGYAVSSFFYALKDSSQDTVRVFKDKDGRRFILFTAEKNGHLDIKYLKGQPKPDEADPTKPDDTDKKLGETPGTPGTPGAPGTPGTPGSPGAPGTPDSSTDKSLSGGSDSKTELKASKHTVLHAGLPKTDDRSNLTLISILLACGSVLIGIALSKIRYAKQDKN